jgi:hypothetical protein
VDRALRFVSLVAGGYLLVIGVATMGLAIFCAVGSCLVPLNSYSGLTELVSGLILFAGVFLLASVANDTGTGSDVIDDLAGDFESG